MEIALLNKAAAVRRGGKDHCVRGVTEIQRVHVDHVLA